MLTPQEVREKSRTGEFQGQTSGHAPGYAQANLCILPKEYAFDFLLFCQRNPKPCPLLHVLEPGVFQLGDIDIRRDVPKYKVFRNGVFVEEILNIGDDIWTEDMVTFVIGCSFSFEDALIRAGLRIRHIDQSRNVPMYNTNIPCKSAGVFHGNMVVSMRPFKAGDIAKAVEICSRYPRVHGAPVHIGDPVFAAVFCFNIAVTYLCAVSVCLQVSLGIADINRPDYGDAVDLVDGDIPVFWACGVTPQAVVMRSKPTICITHAPGHMLVLDELNEALSLS